MCQKVSVCNNDCFYLFMSVVAQNPLCAKACKREGTIKTSFCASEFGKFSAYAPHLQLTNQMFCSDWALLFPVITGKVSSLIPGPRGTLNINVSLIKAYKAGRLTLTQVGETMSVKLVSQCKKCPLLRRGILHTLIHTTDHKNFLKVS